MACGALHFTIPGDPVAKGRGRIVRRGAHLGIVTPEKTRRFESLVRDAAAAAMRAEKLKPLRGSVRLSVVSHWTLAKSHWKKREPVSASPRLQKPDLDNVVKAVADALNGICYLDDQQVVEFGPTSKWNTAQGEAGSTVVEVYSLDGEW